MKPSHFLKSVNIVLAVVTVTVLLGCGGDLATPPPGSTEEKLNGDWQADPLPGGGDIKHTTRELGFTFAEGYGGMWGGPGLIATYCEQVVPVDGPPPSRSSVCEWTRGLTVKGLTATADPSRTTDGSTWVFRLDPDKPEVLYVTWTLKDGTKKLDEVEFRRKP